jgi:serine protease
VQNISLSTGTFAVQGTWSNSASSGRGGCAISHAIVTK